MEAIIAKYKAKILQRLDQEEPLSGEDLLAINDAIRVLSRFEKPSERESRMEPEKIEGPEPIKLIVHAECEMREVKELMKIMTEIQKEYSCNCTLDVKKYVVFH